MKVIRSTYYCLYSAILFLCMVPMFPALLLGQDKGTATEQTFYQQATDQILNSRVFRKRSIAVYRIGGEMERLILQSHTREDSLHRRRIDSLCGIAVTPPVENCSASLRTFMASWSTPYLRNFRAFAAGFAEKCGVEASAVNNDALREMVRSTLDMEALRQNRANHFCLVTTQAAQPKVIGVVELKENEKNAPQVSRLLTGVALRRWLADIHPTTQSRLLDQLAAVSASTQTSDNDLKLLWPATAVAVQQRAPAIDVIDVKATRMIRSREEFADEYITIYEMQEDAADVFSQSFRRNDSLAMVPVIALCTKLYSEPLPDGAATVRELVSSPRTEYGNNRPIFKLALAQKYDIDPMTLNDAVLGELIDSVKAINDRRHVRPWFIRPHYYLVATDDAQPQPLGMVWINEELNPFGADSTGSVENASAGELKLDKVFTGDDFHSELSEIDPQAENMLLRQLPGSPKEGSPFEDVNLVRIWPLQNTLSEQDR